MRLGTRGSPLALAQAQIVADALGDAELVPIKTSGDRGARRRQGAIRRARSSRPCSRARWTWRSTPPRTCRASCPRAWRSRGCPRARTRATPLSARRIRWTRCPRAPGSAPRACGGALSCWRCGRTWSWSTCGATWTRGSSAWRAATSTGSCWRRPACGGSGATGEIAFEFDPEQLTPAAGQGALVARVPRSTTRPRPPAADDQRPGGARDESAAERAVVAALDASCNTPLGRPRRAHRGRADAGARLLRPPRRQRVDPRRAGAGRERPRGPRPGPGRAHGLRGGAATCSPGPSSWRRR